MDDFVMKNTEDLNKQFLADGDDFYVSLVKATGKKVKDIQGYFSDPYGGGTTFGISKVVFEDDSSVHVEGAHDWAFIYDGFPFDLSEYSEDEDE